MKCSALTTISIMFDNSEVPDRRNHRSALPRSLTLIREWVFAHRLPAGLFAVLVAALFVRPTYPKSIGEIILKVVSASLVMAGLALRAWGAGCAGRHTRTSTIEAEKLVTGGPYAFTRNPIYVGSMILGLGMVGMIGDWRLLPLLVVTFAALYFVIIPAEEEFLAKNHPLEYEVYRKNVPRILPRLIPWSAAQPNSFDWQPALGEWRMIVLLVAILAFLYGASLFRG
jgi:protein-S-isoprenylcysteine O-methyltransferase Ste14